MTAQIIAFYLPQYHVIPENELWWGKGFTDWQNVKSALPLFKGHNQPRVPCNNNYYNLMDIESLIQHSTIAIKYGLSGFCYYHYWFNGKLLLQKPLENMLNCRKIKIPFCLSWANEPWTRTWDGSDNRESVLMEQQYTSKEGWTSHFNYLIKYFKDKRYIKIDGKPLFLLYRSNTIPHCDEMIEYWERLIRKSGFKGLYVAETLSGFQKLPVLTRSSAIVEFEPTYILKHSRSLRLWLEKVRNKGFRQIYNKYVEHFNYDNICNLIASHHFQIRSKAIFYGCFPGWDNTPRKKYNGFFMKNTMPSIFKTCLERQYTKAGGSNPGFVFINAWNEWAEGAYLEPDTTHQYSNLRTIAEIAGLRNS